jgi:hypothetical protein
MAHAHMHIDLPQVVHGVASVESVARGKPRLESVPSENERMEEKLLHDWIKDNRHIKNLFVIDSVIINHP